jgi:dTDP-L-rhamnose 4-epimerase
VIEYARLLAEEMGIDVEPVIPGEYRVGDVRHTVSGISKISQLGWRPEKNLRQVFAHYLAWLDTVSDQDDYFTPAYLAMKESGVVRPAQNKDGNGNGNGSEPALAVKSGWAQSSQS